MSHKKIIQNFELYSSIWFGITLAFILILGLNIYSLIEEASISLIFVCLSMIGAGFFLKSKDFIKTKTFVWALALLVSGIYLYLSLYITIFYSILLAWITLAILFFALYRFLYQ